MISASSPTGTVMEWTARPRQMKQGSLLLIGLGYPFPGSSGRFGRPAPRFHTHPVESGFLLGVGAGADNHGISTGAPRHPSSCTQAELSRLKSATSEPAL